MNALDTTTNGKHKSDLSLSAFARRVGKSNGFITQVKHAAEVYREIFSQLKNFDTTSRSQHLFEIHAAPESTWVILAGLLQEHSWSVKDTKAAVDRVRTVSDLAPDWLMDVSSVYPKVAMEPGYAMPLRLQRDSGGFKPNPSLSLPPSRTRLDSAQWKAV